MSFIKNTGLAGVVLVAAAMGWSGCLPGGDLCTSFAGFTATYDYSTDCTGGSVAGRFTLQLPADPNGLPDTRVLSEQARAGGLNAAIGAEFGTADGDLCTNPRDKNQDPTAVLRGLSVSVYPVAIDADRTGVVAFDCGGIGGPYDTSPAHSCSRSSCPPPGGVCKVEQCTLTLQRL